MGGVGGQPVGVREARQLAVAATKDAYPAMVDHQATGVEYERAQVGPAGDLNAIELLAGVPRFDGKDLDRHIPCSKDVL